MPAQTSIPPTRAAAWDALWRWLLSEPPSEDSANDGRAAEMDGGTAGEEVRDGAERSS